MRPAPALCQSFDRLVDPALFPQHVGQQATAPRCASRIRNFAIFGQRSVGQNPPDSERRVAPHRHAGCLDWDEVANQRPFERRGRSVRSGMQASRGVPRSKRSAEGNTHTIAGSARRSDGARPARAVAIVGIKMQPPGARASSPRLRAPLGRVCRGGDRPHARVGQRREIVRRRRSRRHRRRSARSRHRHAMPTTLAIARGSSAARCRS